MYSEGEKFESPSEQRAFSQQRLNEAEFFSDQTSFLFGSLFTATVFAFLCLLLFFFW